MWERNVFCYPHSPNQNEPCIMEQTNQPQPAPSKIMQIGMGFWASKALLAAVKLKLFTQLGGGKKLSAAEIKQALELNTTDRHVYDWLDLLTTFEFLQREGLMETATYSNSLDTEVSLDKQKPSY